MKFLSLCIATLLAASTLSAERILSEARASSLDPSAQEYPEINFVFGDEEKPADLQRASVDPEVKPRGQLVIWLMAYNDELFARLNSYGLHAIQPHYARAWFGILCQPKPNSSHARGDIRLEAATGQDFSPELHLEKPDGMTERARNFLIWLARENPEGDWQQFLTADQSEILWDKVIISGSSHGSTTAARFAKHQKVARVVMLCGPRDQDQSWQAGPTATPGNRFFGFSHTLDLGWTGNHYCRSWELLGLHAYGPVIDVDSTQPPYQNSRRLISSADVDDDPKKAHGSVQPRPSSPKNENGQFLYEPVWKYLYTHPVRKTGIASPADPNCTVDPSP